MADNLFISDSAFPFQRFHGWCQKIYQDIIEYINSNFDLRLSVEPIAFTNTGRLDVAIYLKGGRPRLSVDSSLIKLIFLYNRILPTFVCDAIMRASVSFGTAQALFDLAMDAVYKAQYIQLPSGQHLSVMNVDNFSEYEAYRAQMSRVGLDLRHAFLGSFECPDQQNELKWLDQAASHAQLVLEMSGMQFMFVVFHEIGHLLLGHATGDRADSGSLESEADNFAANQFYAYYDEKVGHSNVLLSTAAVPCLFSIFDLIDVIETAANNAIRYAMPRDFPRPEGAIDRSHPKAAERYLKISKTNPGLLDPNNRLWATVFEVGIQLLQYAFYYGLIDLRNFKRLCRIRSQLLSAEFVMGRVTSETKSRLASIIDIIEGWDTYDLQLGPLKDEIFEGVYDLPFQFGGRAFVARES